ncbi:MAG: hypothetical protein ABI589_07485 [Burkholderiales bacterium]
MSDTNLNDVQRLNYSILAAIRDAARSDLAQACCRYGLEKTSLQTIGGLTPDAVLTFVVKMGNEALFAPRSDLATLLSAPMAALPMLASARNRVSAPAAQSSVN